MDIALHEKKGGKNPLKPIDNSPLKTMTHYAKCEKANQLSSVATKRTIIKHLLTSFPKTTNAKDFLDDAGKRYQISDSTKAATLIRKLSNLRYDETIGMRKFIFEMVHFQSKLKYYKITYL